MQESTNFYDQAGNDARKQDCTFQGNPYGKRPDAMFRAILVRLVQCIGANASATADSADSKQHSSDLTVHLFKLFGMPLNVPCWSLHIFVQYGASRFKCRSLALITSWVFVLHAKQL
eukprot:TRINITY_DN7974_c0_g1_i1.p2 TRINITY_DN7974_c0_g1~~TRINITY_DN7974_c0_g1_i1.p2  ORF type:complete len:134 (-),score=16.58 TRINITY_DN7974_c0_g1_i1:230-580(-)